MYIIYRLKIYRRSDKKVRNAGKTSHGGCQHQGDKHLPVYPRRLSKSALNVKYFNFKKHDENISIGIEDRLRSELEYEAYPIVLLLGNPEPIQVEMSKLIVF